MKNLVRCACLAAVLLAATRAFASSAAPGVQVVVKAGRATVFEAVTDATGRFVTAPLEPGLYSFEVRIPKNVVTPARYFLALSGAKPVGEAMMMPGVPLMMQAQVRRPVSVRGQVTARRVVIVPAAGATTGTGTAQGQSTTTTAGGVSRVASPGYSVPAGRTPAAPTTFTRQPSSAAASIGVRTTPRTVSTPPPRPLGSTPISRPPPITRATPAPTARPLMRNTPPPLVPAPRRTSTLARPATAQTAPAAPQPNAAGLSQRPANSQPRMINGRLHVWVPIAPGSTLGRWLPDRAERPRSTQAAAPATAAQPAKPKPSPSPTPRRR